jgi:GTPase involved in cell partitioning and DNA repair
LDATPEDPERLLIERYLTLRKELQHFNADLMEVPEVVVISKEDTVGQDDPTRAAIEALSEFIESRGGAFATHFLRHRRRLGRTEAKALRSGEEGTGRGCAQGSKENGL